MARSALPPVVFYVSSSVQPDLVEYIRHNARPFRLFHNWIGVTPPSPDWKCPLPSNLEFNYETYLYATLFHSTACTGAGLNAVNRALGIALYLGFDHITILGADCAARALSNRTMPPGGIENASEYEAWLSEQEMYPPGNIPSLAATTVKDTYGADAALLEGQIDGRYWATRPDMIISALSLVRLKQEWGHRIEIVGDTLANALMGKSDEFLKGLPVLGPNSTITNLVSHGLDANGNPIDIPATLQLVNQNRPYYEPHIRANAKYGRYVVGPHQSRAGKTLVIAGAGPSLALDIGLLSTRRYDELWACNRALPWLMKNGPRPTHAIWVDPGPAWKDEWGLTVGKAPAQVKVAQS